MGNRDIKDKKEKKQKKDVKKASVNAPSHTPIVVEVVRKRRKEGDARES